MQEWFGIDVAADDGIWIFLLDFVQNAFHQIHVHNAGFVIVSLTISSMAKRAFQIAHAADFKDISP